MRGVLVGLCMLCGCDDVFMLDRDDGPKTAPVIVAPDGDADGDGDPNATDLCPLIDKSEMGANADADGDGVGNLCDPAPQIPGDCLALFDMFQGNGPLSDHWLSSGEVISKTDGEMIIPESTETVVYLDVIFPLTSLTVGGYIPGGGGRDRAIQLLFDHDLVAGITGITGRACGVESEDEPTRPTQLQLVELVDGMDTVLDANPLNDIPVGAGTSLLLGWNDRHPDTGVSHSGRCHAEVESNDPDLDTPASTGIDAIPPTGSAFALRTKTVAFRVRGVIGYGHNCTQVGQ